MHRPRLPLASSVALLLAASIARAGSELPFFEDDFDDGSYSSWSSVVSPQVPLVGELIVNEIMADPNGTEADREWFELLNVSARDLDLDGCTIDGGPPIVGSHTVPDGGYAVVARNGDSGENGGLTGVVVATFSLLNVSDSIVVACFGTMIDTVTWTFTTISNASALDPAFATAVANDLEENFCVDGGNLYGDESAGTGTPGSLNISCD